MPPFPQVAAAQAWSASKSLFPQNTTEQSRHRNSENGCVSSQRGMWLKLPEEPCGYSVYLTQFSAPDEFPHYEKKKKSHHWSLTLKSSGGNCQLPLSQIYYFTNRIL